MRQGKVGEEWHETNNNNGGSNNRAKKNTHKECEGNETILQAIQENKQCKRNEKDL